MIQCRDPLPDGMDEWTFLNGEGFFGGIEAPSYLLDLERDNYTYLLSKVVKAIRWVKSIRQPREMLYSPADQPTQLQLSLPPCFLS